MPCAGTLQKWVIFLSWALGQKMKAANLVAFIVLQGFMILVMSPNTPKFALLAQ